MITSWLVSTELVSIDAQGCYAWTLTIRVPDNAEVRDNKRRDFSRRKFAMHEPDVEPRQRSPRLRKRSQWQRARSQWLRVVVSMFGVMVFLNRAIPSNRKRLCQVHRRTRKAMLHKSMASPGKQKRVKKPNFSEVENVALSEEIGMEKILLMSHFQNGVTLKKKELMWRKIADKVNALGGNFLSFTNWKWQKVRDFGAVRLGYCGCKFEPFSHANCQWLSLVCIHTWRY